MRRGLYSCFVGGKYLEKYFQTLANGVEMWYTYPMMDLGVFKNKRVCVACSGGVDSTALLHYLLAHAEKYGYTVIAAYCEHGIRGQESLDDLAFVQSLCQKWTVPLYVFREDCPKKAAQEKKSLETAAREFRYTCFQQLIDEGKADYIATAHHLDDDAETVLFRLARGTALSGVGGISSKNGYLVRPFLDKTRKEIEEYAKENGLSYCVDKTNFEKDATRNKLRLDVLPLLEDAVDGATKNIVKFAKTAAEDDAFLQKLAQKLVKKTDEGICVTFSEEKPLFTRACLFAMKALGVEKNYQAVHLEALFALQQSERGAKVDLPNHLQAEKGKSCLYFYIKKDVQYPQKPLPCKFSEDGFDGGMYALNCYFSPENVGDYEGKMLKIDLDKLPQDAVFRFRQEGDVFTKFGGGKKSLKKYFNEKKIPVESREYLPLIAQEDGKLVYVIGGVEIADFLKVTAATQRVACLTIRKKKGD